MVRLQKFLADNGVASRRKSEDLILGGLVKVNNEIVTEMGYKVCDNDCVEYDGKIIGDIKVEYAYIMLHKPEGYITSAKDQFDRPTVMDLLIGVTDRVYPVGRLDYDTSGLILLTNDGDLAYKLTHPKHIIDKVYVAKLFGEPTTEEIQKFENGIMLEDGLTSPANFEIIKKIGRYTTAKITIREGKNRQVRRMCEAIGHKVASLKRIATGKLFLGKLEKGKFRVLSKDEISYLKNL